MQKFLHEVAHELYRQWGSSISDLHIIFPGKRARLYFNEALLEAAADRPIWQPQYRTIDEVVHAMSPLEAGEHLRLVAELYTIYNRYHADSFDRFYRWGEMLLSDFDTIDKYMIDARALYANISDVRDIDSQFGGLFDPDSESMTLVRNFWRTMNARGSHSSEQQQFLKIWRSLYDIYTEYKLRLRQIGIGYAGMIYRDVAENLDNDDTATEPLYCFVGFNALNECETRLFDHLRRGGRARFYWDYDNYFYGDQHQEAGLFIRRNIARFGSDTKEDGAEFDHDNFGQSKNIEVIATPSDILQCKVLYQELQKIYDRQGYLDKETAIVLTDESLLLPVLHSIPPQVATLNVTMGYPITSTMPYVLLERLLQLHAAARRVPSGQGDTVQIEFNHTDVKALLRHPYIMENHAAAANRIIKSIDDLQQVWISPDGMSMALSDTVSDTVMGNVQGTDCEAHAVADLQPDAVLPGLLSRIFRPLSGSTEIQEYLIDILSSLGAISSDTSEDRERKEFIYIILEDVIRLGSTIAQCGISIHGPIYASLLRQMLRSRRVPYSGEPLCGLQIMGILETRNLDFDNVIVLSLTDDTFPGNSDNASYIPFNLRQAFGLPTPAEHEAMWGYYFYRLISRSSNLKLMYSSAADDRLTGEQSRYIYQLEYESPHAVLRANVNLSIEFRPVEPIVVDKTLAMISRMAAMDFYPSKINRYIDCPLKFYFSDIEMLRPAEQISDQVTHLDVGNTLHHALERIYTPLVEAPSASVRLAQVSATDITVAVEESMAEVMGTRAEAIATAGRMQMHRDIVGRYARNIVEYDSRDVSPGDSFVVRGIEQKLRHTFTLAGHNVTLAGVADRIDLVGDGMLRIVDYKSGGDNTEYTSLMSLFTNEAATRDGVVKYESHNAAVLQTLIYGLIVRMSQRTDVVAALYVARRMGQGSDFSPYPVCKAAGGAELRLLDDATVAELQEHLTALFAEILSPDVPFVQTTYRQKCDLCDFRNLCRR